MQSVLVAPSTSCLLPFGFQAQVPLAACRPDVLCMVTVVTPTVLQEFITETRPTGREQERMAERTSEARSGLSCSRASVPLTSCCTHGQS